MFAPLLPISRFSGKTSRCSTYVQRWKASTTLPVFQGFCSENGQPQSTTPSTLIKVWTLNHDQLD